MFDFFLLVLHIDCEDLYLGLQLSDLREVHSEGLLLTLLRWIVGLEKVIILSIIEVLSVRLVLSLAHLILLLIISTPSIMIQGGSRIFLINVLVRSGWPYSLLV